jgi:protein dithiol oxidoreductase (disulfide-forming)
MSRHPIVPRMALCALSAALALACAAAGAQEEGKDYRVLASPQPTGTPGKIEVIEFFSYGCPHCAHFYPLVSAWAAKLPKDVVFRRVPIGFQRPQWVNLQRTFYALQATGDFARLDGALFHAIHDEEQSLYDEASIADWVGRNGGNVDKFTAAYVSFGVNNQTVQADTMAEKYLIDSVPAMAVDGRYVGMADPNRGEMGYLAQLLENTDQLIALARKTHGATAPAPTTSTAPAPRK